MNRLSVIFTSPNQVSVCEEALPGLAPDKLLVQTLFSAISPGTEMLVYRGQLPQGMDVDESIASLAGEFRYPLRYGYSAVGRVIVAAGSGQYCDPRWLQRSLPDRSGRSHPRRTKTLQTRRAASVV